MNTRRRALMSILVLLLSISVAAAQTVTGTMDGHIADPAGAVIPNVKITAHHIETGGDRMTTTNEAGYFQLAFLPLGSYDVTAQMQGFTTVVAKGIEVTLNKTSTVNLMLKLSALQESV